ncbi:alpha/beta hydrolase [Variovorax boronicumulans]|uniref:alpha/beta hydrolase n=1 Tax=Variovorax boronicumulans TaxID=436515 RepID=UPI001C5A0D33
MQKRNVEFKSNGTTIRGILALPEGKGPFPVAVMGGGWCYVKEVVLPHYAENMLKAGVACLMFDYRNFGGSDGDTRQHLDPWAQIDDYKHAISFAITQPEIDANRVAVWGISYAGGHAIIVGATDPRVKAIISTVPVVEGYETMQRCHGERRFADLLKLVAEDRESRFAGKPSAFMAMSSPTPETELSVWPFPHVGKVFNEIKAKEAPLHEHRNTVESLENLLMYNVFPYAKRILNKPTLVVVADQDNITQWDLEIAMYNSIPSGRKELVVLEKTDHMVLYSSKTQLEVASGVHARFLKKHFIDPQQ